MLTVTEDTFHNNKRN